MLHLYTNTISDYYVTIKYFTNFNKKIELIKYA